MANLYPDPDFHRPADQRERDLAGATQRRIESTLHAYWLHLASGRSGNWWDDLVPPTYRQMASRRRRGQGRGAGPEERICRLAFEDFAALFNATFPDELADLIGGSSRRRDYVVELFVSARDAAGHPGRPYLAAEARVVPALAWDVALRIPIDHHDPPDQLMWLRDQMVEEGEGWADEPFDVAEDLPLPAEFWSDLHDLCRSFKRTSAGGDGGFSMAVEDLIGVYHGNLFLKAGELTLGTGLPAFSGLFHENDLGVASTGVRMILELKHRQRGGVTKSDLMIFNQKVLDFQLALIRDGERARIVRGFVTNDTQISDGLRGYCLQWGIVLVEPRTRPIPVLLAALRDLAETASVSDGHTAALALTERLGQALRPLDRILVPSTLSRWRRLIDAGRFPTGNSLDQLVRDHRRVDQYADSLLGTVGS